MAGELEETPRVEHDALPLAEQAGPRSAAIAIVGAGDWGHRCRGVLYLTLCVVAKMAGTTREALLRFLAHHNFYTAATISEGT